MTPEAFFAAAVAAALVAGAGGPLQYAYPAGAFVVSALALRGGLERYVRLVLWLWMLTPFVRRVADLHSGWHEPSLILLTPYVVSAWPPALAATRALLGLLREPPRLSGLSMYLLVGGGVALGLPLGVLASPVSAAVESLNWCVPVAFSLYLATRVRDVAALERTVLATMLQAGVVMGAYAVYQFNVAPLWDTEWMRNTEASSFGVGREGEVRVFSTLHGPGVLACVIVLPIAAWMARPRFPAVLAAVLAGLALALSQVRTAWLALFIATVLIVRFIPARERARLVAYVATACLCAAPFVLPIEVSDVTWTRFLTVFELGRDDSALSRFEGHTLLSDFMGAHPFGIGIGIEDRSLNQVIGTRDSIVVAGIVQFGLLGTVAYLAGLAAMFARLVDAYRRAATPEQVTLAATGIGLLSVSLFGTITAGPLGMFVWLIAGLATARHRLGTQRGAAPRRAPALVVLQPLPALGGRP